MKLRDRKKCGPYVRMYVAKIVKLRKLAWGQFIYLEIALRIVLISDMPVNMEFQQLLSKVEGESQQ